MEFISNTVSQLNWWAVIVATLSTLPVGYIWYDLKVGFGKRWAKLNGIKTKDLESTDGMATTFALMLATSLVTAFLLACLLLATGVEGFWDIVLFGLLFGIVLRGGAHFIHNGFTKKPIELTLLDVGHDMVSLTVMVLILGLWQ